MNCGEIEFFLEYIDDCEDNYDVLVGSSNEIIGFDILRVILILVEFNVRL